MASQLQLIIDDTDPRIQYSLGWSTAGVGNEFKSSTHETETTGASFTFVFNGTSITVSGTIDGLGSNGPPNSTYVLDGAAPVPFRGPSIQGVAYQQIFYQSPTVPNTEHTLVGSCADSGSRLFLDYLVVTSPLPASLPQATVTKVVTQTASPSSANTASGADVNTGAIVGAVIGGVALFVVLICILLLYRRNKTLSTYGDDHVDTTPGLPPFTGGSSYFSGSIVSSQSGTGTDMPPSPPAYVSEFLPPTPAPISRKPGALPLQVLTTTGHRTTNPSFG